MTKRLLFVSFLLLFAGFSFASGLEAEAVSYPSSVYFSWKPVEGAVYYDIYNGQDFVVRLPSSEHSYTVERLLSSESYSFSIAARTEDNITLDASFLDVETGSWDGIYEWVNETDKDNKGKMESYRVRLETRMDPMVGEYHAVYLIKDGMELPIFPLYDFSDKSSGEWVDFDDEGIAGTSYRINAKLFNTSPFNPSKWRMDKVVIDYDSTSAYIQTSAMGMIFETVTRYELYCEDGSMKMSLTTEGSGVVDSFLFRNPNPGEGDAFILTRIG